MAGFIPIAEELLEEAEPVLVEAGEEVAAAAEELAPKVEAAAEGAAEAVEAAGEKIGEAAEAGLEKLQRAIESLSSKAPEAVTQCSETVAAEAETTAPEAEATAQSVADKLDRYLLNPDHPVGGSKAKWFEQALGYTRENMGDLAKQIKFDPTRAVETGVTQYGTKYNQTINIIGANGREIPVEFGWIRNTDGVVRLVTAIPTAK